jgi:hypothetical protein
MRHVRVTLTSRGDMSANPAATKQNTPASIARVATVAQAKREIASPITIRVTPAIRSSHRHRLFDKRLLVKWSTRSCARLDGVILA